MTTKLAPEVYNSNGVRILQGDCIESMRTLPDSSVHCCVTSPPYWGLRDYGCDGQLGLEATPDEYVAGMVDVFREVRRVLRDDGTCWVNIGDSYNAYNGGAGPGSKLSKTQTAHRPSLATGYSLQCKSLKPKDLIGIPWRVALALQSDGWYLRQDIIWHKPSPMPESVRDRCTKAHEYLFLLTKSERYFFDNEAIAEPSGGWNDSQFQTGKTGIHQCNRSQKSRSGNKERKAAAARGVSGDSAKSVTGAVAGAVAGSVPWEGSTRNKRSVWTVATEPYKGAHFAVFPRKLIEPCILAGTSEEGCCDSCGAPYRRITERTRQTRARPNDKTDRHQQGNGVNSCGNTVAGVDSKTVGWEQTCDCDSGIKKCIVLDPFGGSGTTAVVARANGCDAVLCELNPEYIELAKDRLKQKSLF